VSARNLPDHPDLDQLRRQAKELHRAAEAGEAEAIARLAAVGKGHSLNAAQLALAREYGFASWRRLKSDLEIRAAIEAGDAAALTRLLDAQPELANEPMSTAIDGARMPPLDYVGIGLLHNAWRHRRAGELTQALLAAGAPADGLITAASHGEPGMVRVLIEAGADLEAVGRAAPGSGTALAHAVHYGIVPAVDLLVAAGAVIHDLVEAAGAGNIEHFDGTDPLALRAAAVCERLEVIDELLARGSDINAEFTTLSEGHGSTALHSAAWDGKARSVEHLLSRGANPDLRVGGMTALERCRQRRGVGHGGDHDAVAELLPGG
jgi:hypothetical protein